MRFTLSMRHRRCLPAAALLSEVTSQPQNESCRRPGQRWRLHQQCWGADCEAGTAAIAGMSQSSRRSAKVVLLAYKESFCCLLANLAGRKCNGRRFCNLREVM